MQYSIHVLRCFFWVCSVGTSLASQVPTWTPPPSITCRTFPASLAFSTFFVLLAFSYFYRFFVSICLLFRLRLYAKPAANNQLGFFQVYKRLTLSPVTGRRPDCAIFGVDMGVTDVTKSSRLFAVTSTACLFHAFKRTRSCCLCFLHPSTSSKHYIVQHTQSVPIRHPSDKECSVYSQPSRQT